MNLLAYICLAFTIATIIIFARMNSKALKKIFSLLLSFSLLTACSNSEPKYVDKGTQRKISSSSETDSKAAEEETEITTENIKILNTLKSSGKGLYEGTVKLTNENGVMDLQTEFITNDSGDLQLSFSDPLQNKKLSFLFTNNAGNLYMILEEGSNKSAYWLTTTSFFSCIKDHIYEYALDSAVYNNLLMVSDDKDKMLITFNNSTLYTWACSALDLLNADYEEIYKLTQNDITFKNYVYKVLDGEYDLSMGISKTAMEDFTASMALFANYEFIQSAKVSFAGAVLVEEDADGLKLSIEFKGNDINTDKEIIGLEGTLRKSDKIYDALLLPTDIKQYDSISDVISIEKFSDIFSDHYQPPEVKENKDDSDTEMPEIPKKAENMSEE